MSLITLVPRVREALGLNASYDAEIIPALIKRSAQRLLRDYNFPKSVIRWFDAPPLTLPVPGNTGNFVSIPAGAGKVLDVRLYDPVNLTWTNPLKRREGFLPILDTDNLSDWRWYQEGTLLYLTNQADAAMIATNLRIVLWYQTVSPDVATWIYDDFEDVLFYHAVYRGAAENRKPEVAAAFAPLWAEEQRALAIYLHELEFDNLEMVQREERRVYHDRYPRS